MVRWMVYAARAFASLVLLTAAAVFLLMASTGQHVASMIGIAVAFAAVAFFSWPKSPNAWRRDPPTQRQIAYAMDLGIPIPPGISKGDLSDLISQVVER